MLNTEQHRKFLKSLMAVPAAATKEGRTSLLAGLPPNIAFALNRSDNAHIDLTNMLTQLGQLGSLGDTGQSPLMLVAENALMQVEGTEIADTLTEIIHELGHRNDGNALSPEVRDARRIFISYATEDYKAARKLYHDLRARGLNPWLDREDLLPGQKWKTAIRQAIQESSHFLALLSSYSVSKKGFVHKELKMALEVLDEMPETEIFLLPVLLEVCEVRNEKLKDLHWARLFPSYEQGLNQVLRVLMPENNPL